MAADSARNAFYAARDDLSVALSRVEPGYNATIEFSRWDDARATLDEKAGTFCMTVSKLNRVPLNLPATGAGYQILGLVGGWQTSEVAELAPNAAGRGFVSAPSRMQGTLLVSYRWSLSAWARAWIYWIWRRVLRVIAWVFLLTVLAVVAYGVYLLPWAPMARLVYSSYNYLRSPAATPIHASSPTPPPRETSSGHGPRVGNGIG